MPAARTRVTRQGASIEALLGDAEGFRTAQELHAELARRGEQVGLTTVYRHLTHLAEQGAVDVVRGDDGEAAYRRCAVPTHHHHVVCRQCGASTEVDGPDLERWVASVAAGAGFADITHTLEIFGTCENCTS